MGRAVKWLSTNREQFGAYMLEKESADAADVVWWVLTVAVKVFMVSVDECFRGIQGRDTLLCEKNEGLQQLCRALKKSVSIIGPLDNKALLTAVGKIDIVASLLALEGNFLLSLILPSFPSWRTLQLTVRVTCLC